MLNLKKCLLNPTFNIFLCNILEYEKRYNTVGSGTHFYLRYKSQPLWTSGDGPVLPPHPLLYELLRTLSFDFLVVWFRSRPSSRSGSEYRRHKDYPNRSQYYPDAGKWFTNKRVLNKTLLVTLHQVKIKLNESLCTHER